jgi:Domain of unknown function (DUF4349)
MERSSVAGNFTAPRDVEGSMMTSRGRVAAVVLAAGLVVGGLAACASADDDSAGDSASEAAPTTAADMPFDDSGGGGAAPAPPGAAPQESDEAATGAGGGDAGRVAIAPDPAQVVAATRDVVRTGTMQLTVEDVDDAAADITALVTGAGGFVSNEQARAADRQVDLTVRIPADRFEDVRGQIGKLGTVESQQVDAQDVTAEMVDVQSRIESLQASVDRVRGLLSGAGDVGQLAIVEGELARREAELEALQGQQRVLADQVALGTLTVNLAEEPPPPEPADDIPGFGENLHRGWVALVDVGQVALATIALLLPFLVVLVPLGIVGWVWYRRRRRPATPTSTPPSSPSTPPSGPGPKPAPAPEPAPSPAATGD